jgi:hypothetical protein
MNTRGLLAIIFAVALSVAPQLATLVSPRGLGSFSTLGSKSGLSGDQCFPT